MKLRTQLLIVSLLFLSSPFLWASHHFESLLAKEFPQFDLTDLYVFNSDREGFTTFMLSFNPTTKNTPEESFGEEGFYYIHIGDTKGLGENKGLTITAKAGEDGVLFGSIGTFDAPLGDFGTTMGQVNYNEESKLPNGIKVWAGIARDPFVGNSTGIRNFRKQVEATDSNTPILNNFSEGKDGFSVLNSSVIVVEVPDSMLPKRISVFANSTVIHDDQWAQVNRIANPLMTHLFMFTDTAAVIDHVSHQLSDSHPEKTRAAVQQTIHRIASVDDASPKNLKSHTNKVIKAVIPDFITFKVGTEANYTIKKRNGRKPQDDAMDVMLSIALGREVTDNANTFDRHPIAFPYVVPQPID